VWILGGYQSDFARNLAREGTDVAGLFAEVVPATLHAARTDARDVEVIHVGNAFGQLFTGQGHLGAMPATVEPRLSGLPASRHEAACASGGVALLAAMADLEAGRYGVALVVGAELERTVDGARAAELMAAAAWVGHEAEGQRFVWPWAFDELAAEYDRRYGLREEHLHAIGALNRRNARANPNAQTRAWAPDAHDPVVHGRLRRGDCSQITDGAAGVVLASDAALRERGIDPVRAGASRISGWGHRSAALPLHPKLAASADAEYVLPHVRATILDAQRRAGIGTEQLDVIETHDCFTPSQYLAIDHFGITKPGASWQAVESGALERDGRIPMNPSGGLIGGGHPVGATGVRMVLDAHRQVTGTAGGYQVEGARTAATLNIGGSTATCVSFVVTAPH
jgi:acetyl-CoA C-acetyltransferase